MQGVIAVRAGYQEGGITVTAKAKYLETETVSIQGAGNSMKNGLWHGFMIFIIFD